MELVQILKAIADENRLRILNLLRQEPLCVCEIETILEINQSNVSRHLQKLLNTHLIARDKKSQWVYYRIDDRVHLQYPFISEIFNGQLDQIESIRKDQERFSLYKQNGMNCEQIEQN